MPFIDRSTLTYPATNSFPVRKWLDPQRNPTSNDFRQFQIFDIWINDLNDTAWIMVDRTATSGTWVQMASTGTGILTITGNAGGAVGPDGANNINVLGGTNVTVTGNPGTNTLTITLGGGIATSYAGNVGSASPAAGVLNIVGASGITTTGAGNTITITSTPTVPLTFTADAGAAVPALNNLNILGGTLCSTSGAGDTLTVNVDATVASTYTCDSGVATPAANNINVVGSGAASTTGAGDTITINSTGGGVAWIEVVVVGPTALTVDRGYITNNGAQVQLLLPLTAALGSTIIIVGKGAGGWIVQQNAAQTILLGAAASTVGVAGTVAASESSACIEMVCITANTTWRIRDTNGNIIIT